MPSDYAAIAQDNIRRRGEEFDDVGDLIARLYSDRTHFIYELLQNAEDALARRRRRTARGSGQGRVMFRLLRDRLELRHFGKPFDDGDVRAISDVLRGTKAGDANQIGEFGIGFKSVYAFTSTPEIHSGDERFCIERYIRPRAVAPRDLAAGETLFIFPFNRPSVPREEAFTRIEQRLGALGLRTLLFLRNIDEIAWSVSGRPRGQYRRKETRQGPARQVSITGGDNGHTEDWLLFERFVKLPRRKREVRVEAAYLLQESGGRQQIAAIQDSTLVVFFPTEKQTGLGFLVQGPYRTTPARDNVPWDDPANQLLMSETAELVTDSLAQLRDMGLLTVSTLQAMPLHDPQQSNQGMFRPIFEQVREALKTQPLLPTADGDYIPATHAVLARGAELRNLLGERQVQALFGEGATWLADGISQDRAPDLRRYLRDELGVEEVTGETLAVRLDLPFMQSESDEWIKAFYAFLLGQDALWRSGHSSWLRPGPLREKPIIRLEDGTHTEPFDQAGIPRAYLPGELDIDLPTVKRSIAQDRQCSEFLRKLGLSEPDVVAEVLQRILPRYRADDTSAVTEAQQRRDMQIIFRALQTDSKSQKELLVNELKETPSVPCVNADTGARLFLRPDGVYVRSPELELYFEGNPEAHFLSGEYSQDQLELLGELGVSPSVRVYRRLPNATGHVILANSHGNHKRGLNGFDPECRVDGLEHALSCVNVEKAAFIWNALLIPNRICWVGAVQTSSRQSFESAETEWQFSPMALQALTSRWLPDCYGRFHEPEELALSELPEQFQRDALLSQLLSMKETAAAASKVRVVDEVARAYGVDSAEVRYFLYAKGHPDEYDVFIRQKAPSSAGDADGDDEGGVPLLRYAEALESCFSRPAERVQEENPHAPTPVENPKTRRDRVSRQIQDAVDNEPPPQLRFRKVPRKVWDAKDPGVRAFLREEYGGRCQICGGGFCKHDGEPYFEGLYLVSHTQAEWIDRPGNVLCLCPTCCAKFRFGAVEAYDIRGQILAFRAVKEGGAAEPKLSITLCGEDTSVDFSERHMLDLQEILNVSMESGGAS